MSSSDSAAFGVYLLLAHHNRDINTLRPPYNATAPHQALDHISRSHTQHLNEVRSSLQHHNPSLIESLTATSTAAMTNINELSAIACDLRVDAEQNATETATVVAQVLGTPELLEGILSHLPVLDLVVATGVNKTLRNVVQTSPELQRKLFMLPSKDKAEYWQLVPQKSETSDARPESTHFYRMESPGVIGNVELQAHLEFNTSDQHHWADPRRSLEVVTVCPLLEVKRRCPEYLGKVKRQFLTPADFLGQFPISTLRADLSRSAIYADEPWTNMFFTNPPCQEASMDLIWDGYYDGKRDVILQAFGKVRCEDGITLAMLVDKISSETCTIEIMTWTEDSREDDDWINSEVKDTTMNDQVALYRTQTPDRYMEMSVHSTIYIPSIVAPTGSEYQEMAVCNHVSITKE